MVRLYFILPTLHFGYYTSLKLYTFITSIL